MEEPVAPGRGRFPTVRYSYSRVGGVGGGSEGGVGRAPVSGSSAAPEDVAGRPRTTPIVRYVYTPAKLVPVVLPNGRRELIGSSTDECVGDLSRRVCVAEGLDPPETGQAPIIATVGGREVSAETPLSSLPPDAPVTMQFPAGGPVPSKNAPRRVTVGLPGGRQVLCAVSR